MVSCSVFHGSCEPYRSSDRLWRHDNVRVPGTLPTITAIAENSVAYLLYTRYHGSGQIDRKLHEQSAPRLHYGRPGWPDRTPVSDVTCAIPQQLNLACIVYIHTSPSCSLWPHMPRGRTRAAIPHVRAMCEKWAIKYEVKSVHNAYYDVFK